MSTRLTFLYPHLYRSIRIAEPASQAIRIRSQARRRQYLDVRGFTTTRKTEQHFIQRHGKAVEPVLVEGETEVNTKVYTPEEDANKQKAKPTSKEIEEEEEEEEEEHNSSAAPTQSNNFSSAPLSEETQAAAVLSVDDASAPSQENATGKVGEGSGTSKQTAIGGVNTSESKSSTETILEMPPPESLEATNAAKPPHLQTPPYVHHFDTYTLVQQVEKGGFTNDQSITAMKAVRGLLALNLDVAKAGLVSKSDVENETYLFRAACSELKTEVQNSRKANEEAMRRERTLLLHEVDILNQKLTQELLALKDDLKGMFDDRKMTVRQEQRARESAIQGLNYKITVSLNSDAKSEVEGLRWVLTRRSVTGILFMAFMVLTSLRYASYKSHENEEKRKKEAVEKADGTHDEMPAPSLAEILAAN